MNDFDDWGIGPASPPDDTKGTDWRFSDTPSQAGDQDSGLASSPGTDAWELDGVGSAEKPSASDWDAPPPPSAGKRFPWFVAILTTLFLIALIIVGIVWIGKSRFPSENDKAETIPGQSASPTPSPSPASPDGSSTAILVSQTLMANGDIEVIFRAELDGLNPSGMYMAGFMASRQGSALQNAGDSTLISQTAACTITATMALDSSELGKQYQYMVFYYSLDGREICFGDLCWMTINASTAEPSSPTPKPSATPKLTVSPKPTASPTLQPTAKPTATQKPTSAVKPSPSPQAAPEPTPAADAFSLYKPMTRYFYQQLTPNQKAIFNEIYDGICSFEEKITLSVPCTEEDYSVIRIALYYDCPELFCYNEEEGFIRHVTPDGIIRSFTCPYIMTKSEYNRQLKQVMQIIKSISARSDFGSDEYSRELSIYRYLTENLRYDKEQPYAGSINTAFLKGYAKCDGYAKAFNLALRVYGIPCAQIIGDTYDNGTISPTRHSWSAVQINGEWYQADITWDDHDDVANYAPAPDEPEYLSYFNVTDAQMLSVRTIDAADYAGLPLPKCNAARDNYYARNGWQISPGENLRDTLHALLDNAYAEGVHAVALSFQSGIDFNTMMVNHEAWTKEWRNGQAYIRSWSYMYRYETGLFYLYNIRFSR